MRTPQFRTPRFRAPQFIRTSTLSAGVLALFAATTLSACTNGASEAAPDPTELVGKTYVSDAVTGPEIPGGGPLVLGFTENATDKTTNLHANAGCNGLGGTVTFDGDAMTASNLFGTMMACPPPREHTDKWVSDLLADPVTWALQGTTLTLSRGDQRVVLVERENRPVVGTRWQVTALVTKQAVTRSVALEEAKPHFEIAEDGAMSGNTGCNSMHGTAKTATTDPTSEEIEFSRIATTRMACPPDAMEIEQTVLAALQGKATVTVEGDEMKLTNVADPTVGLRLTAS
ncbi:META domain-containing protein [Gordonia sp. (in: high G+C Gram-positive bacteria)]|uniref:META domain-containing protein n=1 Tax=Gordonia sp. (in: high G+C Gram-positive bacteria) TaxID=84139 RepID=UPI003C75E498